MKNSILSLCLFVVMLNSSCAQNPDNKAVTAENIPFSAELFIDELQIPWGFAFLPDGSVLITEKSGELIHFSNGKKLIIGNTPEVYQRGQGGLLDVVLHPNYTENGWIYFTYSSEDGDGKGGNTALMRAKLKGDVLVENQVLYKASPNTTKGQHFGSRITFDNEGYLYFSVGDRGARDENPQDVTRDGGKIYRLMDDGSVPKTTLL